MLFVAQGSIRSEVAADQKAAVQAWLGPMVDAGVLQAGWLDRDGRKVWMVLSAATPSELEERLGNLPVVATRQVEFALFPVMALRYR